MASDEKKVHLSQDSPTEEEQDLGTGQHHNIPTEILKHSHDADEALKAYESFDPSELVLDEETNRRLLRKIDLNMMPIMCMIYMLNYLDKTAISYGSVMGMKKDIGLVGDDYQWLSSMFYFGYLAWEWPTNRLLQRLPVGKYSAFNVIMWGLTLSCFAAVTNFSGGLAVRFFLGVFEAAVTPGFAYITAQWYTKKEQGLRTGFWFSFNGVAQVVGGCVAYGIDQGVAKHGAVIASWKIVFLVIGLFTFAVGVVYWFIVPDTQLNAWFLTKKERVLAIERIRVNEQGVKNKHFKLYQVKEAFLDPQTWMMVFYALVADIPNGGISNFFSQLVVSFGFTESESLLWGTPAGAVEVVTLIAWGLLTYYFGQRIILSMPFLCIAILGIVLVVALPIDNSNGRLAGYYLTQASPVPFVALLSLVGTNVAGYTKKTTVGAMYLVAYCVGNIIGPQTFRPKDAPRYEPAEITIIACWAACLVDLLALVLYLSWQNRKKQSARAQPGYEKLENQEFLDLTDRENPEFVYTL